MLDISQIPPIQLPDVFRRLLYREIGPSADRIRRVCGFVAEIFRWLGLAEFANRIDWRNRIIDQIATGCAQYVGAVQRGVLRPNLAEYEQYERQLLPRPFVCPLVVRDAHPLSSEQLTRMIDNAESGAQERVYALLQEYALNVWNKRWPVCPIGHTLIFDPVGDPTISVDQRSRSDIYYYERSNLSRWARQKQSSPGTRGSLSVDSLIDLVDMKKNIRDALAANRNRILDLLA
jgi:hypothetical protein